MTTRGHPANFFATDKKAVKAKKKAKRKETAVR